MSVAVHDRTWRADENVCDPGKNPREHADNNALTGSVVDIPPRVRPEASRQAQVLWDVDFDSYVMLYIAIIHIIKQEIDDEVQ
ncbi:MAG: hypothetical protein B5766_04285 [Candidatus Lumbricidophila eiseniae]|uniref:Uncharacterized protein n=1 Tax=Candidatus Lumbricidiphila eiseniae TaxID=1969409 RepID=A0A2A6FTD6_9MICO|nr:MAG: hypothetical protein B5766_04285 [Candidatus Lumbricidophila eiseniae]